MPNTIRNSSPIRIIEIVVLYVVAVFVLGLNASCWLYDQTLNLSVSWIQDLTIMVMISSCLLLVVVKNSWDTIKSLWKSIISVLFPGILYLVNSTDAAGQKSFLNGFVIPLVSFVILFGVIRKKVDLWRVLNNCVCVISAVSLFFFVFGTQLHVIPPMLYMNRIWGAWEPVPIANYYYLYYEAQVSRFATFDLWRNCGLFADANLFCSVLCIALAAEIFLYKREHRRCVISILAITLITTFSTIGLCFLFFCGSFFVLDHKKTKSFLQRFNKEVRWLMVGGVTVVVGLVAFILFKLLGNDFVVVKFDHVATCFSLWKEKLLFGYGWNQQQMFLETAKFSQEPSVGLPFYLYTGGLVLGVLIIVPFILSLVNGIKRKKYSLFLFNTLFLFVFFFTAISAYPLVQLFIAYNVMYSFEDDEHVVRPQKFLSKRRVVSICALILIAACAFVIVAGQLKAKYSVKKITTVESGFSIEEPFLFDVNEMYLHSDFRSNSWFFIRGWFIEQGVDSSGSELSIVLVDQNTGDSYRLPTSMVIRTDVTNAYGNGTNLDESGFMAYLLLDDLFADEYYYYDLYFEVQHDGHTTYFDPHISLDCFYEEE